MNKAEKLRILYITRQYPPDIDGGGIAPYVSSTAAALAGRGHEVHVLCCSEGQENRDYEDRKVIVHRRAGRIPARPLWVWLRGIVNKAFKMPRTLWRLEKGIEVYFESMRLGLDFDVIEYSDDVAMGCVLAFLRRRPLVAGLHIPPPSKYEIEMNRDMSRAWSLVYYSCRRAHATTVLSACHLEALKADGWDPGEHIEIIPNAVDCGRWNAARPAEKAHPVVLFVGRLEKIKAPEVLVAAMALVREKMPRATAVFVGKNGERDGLSYVDWIKAAGVDTSGCFFIGEIPRDQVINFLSSSRVLAMPSVFDVYPMACLEAMAAGRPVVVTTTTGVADQIEESGAGKAVPAGDPQALAEALLPFLMDARHASAAGALGRAAVGERNNVENIAARREKVYRQAIARFHDRGAAKGRARTRIESC